MFLTLDDLLRNQNSVCNDSVTLLKINGFLCWISGLIWNERYWMGSGTVWYQVLLIIVGK